MFLIENSEFRQIRDKRHSVYPRNNTRLFNIHYGRLCLVLYGRCSSVQAAAWTTLLLPEITEIVLAAKQLMKAETRGRWMYIILPDSQVIVDMVRAVSCAVVSGREDQERNMN